MSHLLPANKTPWRRELWLVHQCQPEGALVFASHVHSGAVVVRFPRGADGDPEGDLEGNVKRSAGKNAEGDALCIGRPLADECALISRATAESQSNVFTISEGPWSVEEMREWFTKLRDGAESVTAEEIDIAYRLECDVFVDMALELELGPSF
jgi:hypothetical protein